MQIILLLCISSCAFVLGFTAAIIIERRKIASETMWNAEILDRINRIEEYVVEHHDYINNLCQENVQIVDRLKKDVSTAQLEIKYLSSEFEWSTDDNITLQLPIVEKQ